MGTFGSVLTKKKIAKILGITIAAPVMSCLALYLFLVSMQAYSRWQAGRILNSLESLRVGDSSADFEKAVQGCQMVKTSSGNSYVLSAGAFRWQGLWKLVWKLPDNWVYGLGQLANRTGMRYWYLYVSSSAEHGRIIEVSASLYLVGRYEALGTKWQIAPNIPSRYVREGLAPADRRTYMGWFHLTSMPSGEGFGIYATPASTEKELGTRRINRRCFFSFRGCDGLCELLPDAVPVLYDRNRSWGGCSDVPRSWCELKNDDCRNILTK